MIKYIRGWGVAICFVIFGIGTLFMAYVCFPIIKYLNKKAYNRLSKYSLFIQKSWNLFVHFLIFIKIIDIKSKDIEKLKNIKNSVIVTTHPSFIDGIILLSLIPKTTCLVAKRLSENFITKNIVNSMFIISGIPVDDIISQTNYMLNNDFNVLVFPSGKRHKSTEFPKIRKGAAMIAMDANKNIIPIKMYTNIPFLQINEPVDKPLNKVVEYSIEVKEQINIDDFVKQYDDLIIQKREITKEITKSLYS